MNDLERSLRVALDALPPPVFAVLDGAHFDDLEEELADIGIPSRSLFLRGGDEAMRRDGPWLVALAVQGLRAANQGIPSDEWWPSNWTTDIFDALGR